MFLNFNNSSRKGFTLIELLVVIAIIGILAAVVLASLDDVRNSSRESRAQSEMRNIHAAMEMLYNATGLYPHGKSHYCPPINGSNNEVNLNNSASLDPFLETAIDPWGMPYFLDEDYQCTSGAKGCDGIADGGTDSSVLVSCGPDKQTTGSNGNACAYNDDNIVYVFCRN